MDLSPYLIRIRQLERIIMDSWYVIAAQDPWCPLLHEIGAVLDEMDGLHGAEPFSQALGLLSFDNDCQII